MSQPIQPPRPNELNDLFDTLLDENVHIDNYVRNSHTSAWNQRDILNKIITVNDSALRLKEIADWENDEAQTQYQQYGIKTTYLSNYCTETCPNSSLYRPGTTGRLLQQGCSSNFLCRYTYH
ncbi:289_t:CDS:2 [Entrophospora sp. SA101]|nr:289_t:CDS:2 [Entrophospora sp. SA101]